MAILAVLSVVLYQELHYSNFLESIASIEGM